MTQSVYEDMTKSEKEVADYLYELKIWWQFEQPIYVWDDKDRPRVWTPDFYLPELGIYIEVCGSEKFDYRYRAGIYKKNRVPVIFIHRFKNKKQWSKFFRERIFEIHAQRLAIIQKILN